MKWFAMWRRAVVAILVSALAGGLSSAAQAGSSGTIAGTKAASAPCTVSHGGATWIFFVGKDGRLMSVRASEGATGAPGAGGAGAPTFTAVSAVGGKGPEKLCTFQRPQAVSVPSRNELYVFFGAGEGPRKDCGTLHYVRYIGNELRGGGDLVIPKSPIPELVAIGEFGLTAVDGGVLLALVSPLSKTRVAFARFLFADRKKGDRKWSPRGVSHVAIEAADKLNVTTPKKVQTLKDALKAGGDGVSSVAMPTSGAASATKVAIGLGIRNATGAKWRNLLFGEVTIDPQWRSAAADWYRHEFVFKPELWSTLAFSAPYLFQDASGAIYATYSGDDQKGNPVPQFMRKAPKANQWKLLPAPEAGVTGRGVTSAAFGTRVLACSVDAKDRITFRVTP